VNSARSASIGGFGFMSSAIKKPKKAYAIAISSFAAMKTPIISFNSKPAIIKHNASVVSEISLVRASHLARNQITTTTT